VDPSSGTVFPLSTARQLLHENAIGTRSYSACGDDSRAAVSMFFNEPGPPRRSQSVGIFLIPSDCAGPLA
jgi:hypothetical protein